METQKSFLCKLALLAKVCGVTLTPDLVELFDRGLRRFGYEAAGAAVERHTIERRGVDRFPSIADLARLIVPSVSDEDQAVEAAGRVIQAIDKFGWNNQREAEQFCGEVAWYVVNRNGGWVSLCEGALSRNIPTMKAQFREMALSAIRRNRAGTLSVAPSFEKNKTDSAVALRPISELIKSIGGTNEKK